MRRIATGMMVMRASEEEEEEDECDGDLDDGFLIVENSIVAGEMQNSGG